MFQLTKDEAEEWWLAVNANRLRSQSVILKRGQHLKYKPYDFTEHGILMLSPVLNSERAIEVNIEIMRAFVRLRQILLSNADLSRRLDEVEKKVRSSVQGRVRRESKTDGFTTSSSRGHRLPFAVRKKVTLKRHGPTRDVARERLAHRFMARHAIV